MTAFRSLTDEQLAARWDDKPYRDDFGNRYATKVALDFEYRVMHYDPRVERIPSRDLLPYVQAFDTGFRASVEDVRWSSRPHVWAPRPEFARPPVNGILVEFRETRERFPEGVAVQASHWLEALALDTEDATPAEVEHARKVLTKLAKLTQGSRGAPHGIEP